jgi:hypothetical protein
MDDREVWAALALPVVEESLSPMSGRNIANGILRCSPGDSAFRDSWE